jgi:hypothetical protein
MPYSNFVAVFKSTDLNAPPLFGAIGSAINVFNACLVDGFGYTGLAIASITRSGTTATATVTAAIGLRIRDQAFVTVSGCTGTGAAQYNIGALWTRASATTYTYTMLSDPGASASGTPVASLALPVTSATETGTNYAVVLAQADSSLVVGHYITFAGGSPAGFNVSMRVSAVASPTSITCVGPGGLGAITGTVTYQRSPLQWTRPFAAGTNSQSYRSADTSSNQFYFQVVDNNVPAGGNINAQIYGAEVLTADNVANNGGGTGSGQFPAFNATAALNGVPFRKSTTADSTNARAWTLMGDGKTFYISVVEASRTPWAGFGHLIPYKAGDGFNTFVAGDGIVYNTANAATSCLFTSPPAALFAAGTSGYGYIARGFAQIGAPITTVLTAPGSKALTFPQPMDSGVVFTPLIAADSAAASGPRGRMPGLYSHCHTVDPFVQYDEITGVTGLSGVTLMCVTNGINNSTSIFFVDKFGPWT